MELVKEFTDPLEKYLTIVSNTVSQVPQIDNGLKQVEEQLKIKREYVVAMFFGLMAVLVLLFSGLRGVGYLVGFIIPTFESWKAIKSPELDDDRKWLIYWVVYSFITTLEGLSDVLLSWIPFYEVLKIVLFIALWHERTEGAQVLLQFLNSSAGKIKEKVGEQMNQEKKIY